MGSRTECDSSEEHAAERERSKKMNKLLQKVPPFVRYVFVIKPRNAILYPVAFRIASRRRWFFTYNNHQYHYFYHLYNQTWRDERAVELPIIWDEVKKVDGERVLEIGNVLSHYYPVHHDIVDKHEKGDGIINCDILDFHTPKVYDLIVSISTIEHIGLDEELFVQKETALQPEKPLCVMNKLKGMLSQNGKCIVTIPVGYNHALDRLLEEEDGSLFTNRYYLTRTSRSNRWAEAKQEDIREAKYDFPFSKANALAIYVLERQRP